MRWRKALPGMKIQSCKRIERRCGWLVSKKGRKTKRKEISAQNFCPILLRLYGYCPFFPLSCELLSNHLALLCAPHHWHSAWIKVGDSGSLGWWCFSFFIKALVELLRTKTGQLNWGSKQTKQGTKSQITAQRARTQEEVPRNGASLANLRLSQNQIYKFNYFFNLIFFIISLIKISSEWLPFLNYTQRGVGQGRHQLGVEGMMVRGEWDGQMSGQQGKSTMLSVEGHVLNCTKGNRWKMGSTVKL